MDLCPDCASDIQRNARSTVQSEWVEQAKATAVAAVEAGMSEAEAARTVGLDRMTVRKALGK